MRGRRAVNMTGNVYGRLTVIERAPNIGRRVLWLCRCDCGSEKAVDGSSLRQGLTRSCGCIGRRSEVSYAGAHDRVVRMHGRAREHLCECGKPAEEWAYDHADPDERHEIKTTNRGTWDLAYSDSPDHYRPMCHGCHVSFDRTWFKTGGAS